MPRSLPHHPKLEALGSVWTGLRRDGRLQLGWQGNCTSIDIILEEKKTLFGGGGGCLFFAALFYYYFFLPSHQICLSHPIVCVALLQMDVEQMPVCAAIKDCCFDFCMSKANHEQTKQKKDLFIFSFFFWSLPPLFVVISHSCFVSFVSISKCPPPLGLWGTTHTAIWPTTTTGWEETPAETTG